MERSRIRHVAAVALAGMMMAMPTAGGAAGAGDPQAAPVRLPASGCLVNAMRRAKLKIFNVRRCRVIEHHKGESDMRPDKSARSTALSAISDGGGYGR
jgi:hypothetical protein